MRDSLVVRQLVRGGEVVSERTAPGPDGCPPEFRWWPPSGDRSSGSAVAIQGVRGKRDRHRRDDFQSRFISAIFKADSPH